MQFQTGIDNSPLLLHKNAGPPDIFGDNVLYIGEIVSVAPCKTAIIN